MSVILMEAYLVRHEKWAEYQSSLKEFIKFKKGHPKVFEGLRSWRLLQLSYGGVANSYVEMWEFDSLPDLENCSARLRQTKAMKKILADFYDEIDHTTFTRTIWETVA